MLLGVGSVVVGVWYGVVKLPVMFRWGVLCCGVELCACIVYVRCCGSVECSAVSW